MNRFQQTTPPPTQPVNPSYSDRQFLHTFLAGALLPFVQASITAIVAGVSTFILLYFVNAIDLLKPALIVATITWAATWLILQRRWLNLTALERALQLDINKDGHIGKPPPKRETVVWINDVTVQGHVSANRRALPIEHDERVFFADGLINRGRPCSRREWTPKARGFSDDEYRELQSALLKFQIIEPQGSGFELTKAGKALMKYWASLSTTPIMDVP